MRAVLGALLSRAAWGSDLAYVVRPEGCAYDRWTDPCRGGASCQTLAEAGLTCSGIMDIDGCDTACSYPCCVATTTLTHTETMTHTTATATATHTETVTTATITATLTDTATATSTETVVETTAVVATTETVVATTTEEPTSSSTTTAASTAASTTTSEHHEHHVVTNSTTEEVETTAGPSTRGPAAVMKLTMRVEVRDTEDYREYFEDPLIRQAYINVMSEVSTVPKEQLQVEMSSEELGYIMVTYIMTIPYSDGEPSLPMAEIQEKLSSIDMPTFNELLDKEISEVAGEGKYQQKVVSVNVADVPVNAAFQHHVPKAVLSAFAVLLAGL
ncbi:Exportin-T (Exportin(tRNA)) (tRNA exportin) [Durusdinium trenchii]|uniref:Exportin-T (Exportin(tRNA)) (tRNA exportin) n=1 Tax=Durusdinium trenchii TaxID=1381693 RepID=A0ABP0JFP7_9DINO